MRPVHTLTPEKLDILLYGTRGQEVTVHYQGKTGAKPPSALPFEGIIPTWSAATAKPTRVYARQISEFMSERPCPDLRRSAPAPEALAVTIDELNIVEVTGWPVMRTLALGGPPARSRAPSPTRQQAISERILKEINLAWAFWSMSAWIT
jgi:excinuclease ABC subunit A